MKTLKLIFHAFRNLFVRWLPNFKKKEYAFAFLVHPRNIEDTYRKYPFFKYFPEKFLLFFLRHFWPVVLSEVEGLKSLKDGKPVKGFIITIPLVPSQILGNRELAKKKIIQAIKLAEKMGVKLVGLGALIASITNNGKDLINYCNSFITSGNSFTAGIAVSEIENILKNKNSSKVNLAIIGATTPIGSVVSKILASKNKFNSLILIGKTPSHIEEIKDEINKLNNLIKIKTSTEIKDIIKADIIAIMTSAKIDITSEYIKQNAIIYDISQPQSLPEEIIRQRKDVKFIKGGLVNTPGINYHFNFGIPRESSFGCLVETMILAGENIKKHYSLDKIDVEQVKEILNLADKYGFRSNSS